MKQLDVYRMPQVSKLHFSNMKFYFVHLLKHIFIIVFRLEAFTWKNFQNFVSRDSCFINYYGFYEISSFWRSLNDVIEDVNEITPELRIMSFLNKLLMTSKTHCKGNWVKPVNNGHLGSVAFVVFQKCPLLRDKNIHITYTLRMKKFR